MFEQRNDRQRHSPFAAPRALAALAAGLIVLALLLVPVLINDDTHATVQAGMKEACPLTWSVVPSPNVGALWAVEVVSANDVWTGGENGFLHWDGTTWTSVAKPNSGAVRGIAAVAPNDLWAVAADGAILHWDGASWNLVTQVDGALVGIAAVSANDIWAVGNTAGANTLTVHWDGVSWSTVASPRGYLFGVTTLAANDVWAVGGGAQWPWDPLTLHWDGTSWSIVPSLGSDLAYETLSAVAAVATDDVWAVGTAPGHTTIINSLALHWNGTEWIRVRTAPNGLNGIVALAANDVWAVGWFWSGAPVTKRPTIEHWDGQAWQAEFLPRLDGVTLYAIDALSSQDLWTVGASGDQSLILHGTLPCVTPTPTPTVTPTSTPCPLPAPRLSTPKDRAVVSEPRVNLAWAQVPCTTFYRVLVKRDSPRGQRADRARVTTPYYQTVPLTPFHLYYWRVRACSRATIASSDGTTRRAASCSDWSPWRTFAYVPSRE